MDLFEAIAKRASVRKLRPVEVPEADLERILDAGRRAPSGMNRQPVDFVVVRDPATLQALGAAQSSLAEVSVVIVLVADPRASRFWLEDLAAAAENMLLALTALGYASVWIEGTFLRDEATHKQTLGVPEELRLMVALPLGLPDQEVAQAPKRSLAQKVHWEQWGQREG